MLRRRDEGDAASAELPLNAPLLRAALRNETHSHLDGASRADGVRLIQQTHGNAYVQRLMQPATAAIQREKASRTVPGLPAEAVKDVETRIGEDRQGALDRMAAALAARSSIDLSFLEGRTITYVEDKTGMAPGHFGHTSIAPGDTRPRLCSIVIGPDAFQSVSDLYATVMHEWKHVLQFRKPDPSTEAMDELDAFLWEIENLEKTGLDRNPEYIERMAGIIDTWWNSLSPEQIAVMKQRYVAAWAIIRRKRFEFAEAQGKK
jgi:hypothetical protein